MAIVIDGFQSKGAETDGGLPLFDFNWSCNFELTAIKHFTTT